MKNKKAQAWGFDLIVASTIFVIAIIGFFVYTMNYSSDAGVEDMSSEGESISESLVSEGAPLNWNASTIERIGLTSNGKINETKLLEFKNMDYARTRTLLRTKYNYYVYFSEPIEINGIAIDGIGLNATNSNNLIKITRFVVYDNKIISMNINIWS